MSYERPSESAHPGRTSLRAWIASFGALTMLVLTACGGTGGSASGGGGCSPKLGHPPLVQTGRLISVINPTVPPIQYTDPNGNIVGLDPDFGAAIAKQLCLQQQLVSAEFSSMIPGVKGGRYDMVNSFMFYTPERASQVTMVPYGASTISLVVPKDNKDHITGPESFSGKKFGVELGTVDATDAQEASSKLTAAGKPGIDIHTFPTYAAVLSALRAGQVDGAFLPDSSAYYYRNHGQDFYRTALTGFDPHTEALAFSERKLADEVANVLNAKRKDGSLQKLFSGYHHCLLPGPYGVKTGPIATPQCSGQGGS